MAPTLFKASEVWKETDTVVLKGMGVWNPGSWGFFNLHPKSHLDTIRAKATNPFIGLAYTTKDAHGATDEDRGGICGFYLLSHEEANRIDFTDPSGHGDQPDKWMWGFKPYAAFRFLPEERLSAEALWPERVRRGRAAHVARAGDIIQEKDTIARLRALHVEEDVLFRSGQASPPAPEGLDGRGWVRPGPNRTSGYYVESPEGDFPRHLYVMRLHGEEAHYLHDAPKGRMIVKVGLSYSPKARCGDLRKAWPAGKYRWEVMWPSAAVKGFAGHYDAAEAGERAMKKFLAKEGSYLGGEFYAATERQVEDAWRIGNEVAEKYPLTDIGEEHFWSKRI